MSADIDCAVFTAPHHGTWIDDWLMRNGEMRRLHLTPVSLSAVDPSPGGAERSGGSAGFSVLPVSVLQDTCHTLYRYQACLMPVDATTLSWVRTALSSLTSDLPVPLLCITRALKAEAVSDLFRFGLLDFIDHHASQDEIRARCTEVVRNRRHRHRVCASVSPSESSMHAHATPLATQTTGVADGHAIYHSGGRASLQSALHLSSHGRPRSSGRTADPVTPPVGALVQTETSFRQAKQHVIDHFEAQFLKTALAQHRGNVAGAARACAKHRRAFWALMRKHGIDANTFRKSQVKMPLG